MLERFVIVVLVTLRRSISMMFHPCSSPLIIILVPPHTPRPSTGYYVQIKGILCFKFTFNLLIKSTDNIRLISSWPLKKHRGWSIWKLYFLYLKSSRLVSRQSSWSHLLASVLTFLLPHFRHSSVQNKFFHLSSGLKLLVSFSLIIDYPVLIFPSQHSFLIKY